MNQSEFLEKVVELVQGSEQAGTPEGLQAATLGYWIRGRLQADWRPLGYPQLKHVIAALEQRGDVVAGPNAKGALAVWLPDAGRPRTQSSAPPAANGSVATLPRSLYLRKDVWLAFVAPTTGEHYFNHSTGAIERASGSSRGAEWTRIERIDEDTQRGWARAFLSECGLEADPEIAPALHAARWYSEFSQSLARRSPNLAKAWQLDRSERVRTHVIAWCQRHGIDSALVVESPRREPDVAVDAAKARDRVDGDALRAALLAALQEMTTRELLSLPIPARYLVSALRPDLDGRS